MGPDLRVLDHPLITGTLFYPRRLDLAEVPALEAGRVEMIEVGTDRLGAYWLRPFPDAPTIVFFHGNGEVMSDYFEGFHQAVTALGHNFMVVDYRGYGLSSGSPSLSRLLEDARAAWRHVVGPMGQKPSKVVLMGRSLGSLAALEAATRAGPELRGLVLESGIARFDAWIDRMGPMLAPLGLDLPRLKAGLAAAFDQEAKLKQVKAPVLVMHAPFDEIVPVEHGEALASYGDPARTTLHIFERGGHNDIHLVNQREYFGILSRFLGSLAP